MEYAYSKSTLPSIAYLNLDGYIDPIQIQILKQF